MVARVHINGKLPTVLSNTPSLTSEGLARVSCYASIARVFQLSEKSNRLYYGVNYGA